MLDAASRICVFKEVECNGNNMFLWFRAADDEELELGSDYIIPETMLTEEQHEEMLCFGW